MTRCVLGDSGELARQGCWVFPPSDDLRQTINGLLVDARSFFQGTSVEEKLRHRTSEGEGYRAFGTEYTDSPDQPDMVEVFACSVPRSGVRASFPPGTGLALYDALLAAHPLYAELAESLARRLLASTGIDVAEDLRFDFLDWSRLQLNYGVTRRVQRPLLNVLHEDGNFFTIGFATAPGLELATDADALDLWSASSQSLVLLSGSILSAATHGAIPPGFHLVRRRADVVERISIIYFADASPAALVLIDPSRSEEDFFARITAGWMSSGVAPVQAFLTPKSSRR